MRAEQQGSVSLTSVSNTISPALGQQKHGHSAGRYDTVFLESQLETKACKILVDTCVQSADVHLICLEYLSEERPQTPNGKELTEKSKLVTQLW